MDVNKVVRCPCCRGSNISNLEEKFFNAYFCPMCDHVWYDACLYPISQSEYEGSEKYENYYVGRPPFLWYHRKAQHYLHHNLDGGRVLDFGCFDGFFTARLTKAGFDAYGCDWNRKAIERGRRKYGLGDRLSLEPDGQYEAIVALEVIEHFTDPNNFLNAVLPHLAPNGALILSCPNKNSVYRPKTDSPPHHFSRFSEKSLAALLASHGMAIEIQEHEMSIFQLVRNYLGDMLRREAPLLNQDAAPRVKASHFYRLKLLANAFAGWSSFVLYPVDTIAHTLGFAYLSQFVVARRDSSTRIKQGETPKSPLVVKRFRGGNHRMTPEQVGYLD